MNKLITNITAITAATLLASCGSEAPKPAAVEKAGALSPGEYEVSSEVTKIQSADKSTPATTAKLGDKAVTRACVAADGTIEPAMFIDTGDSCSAQSTYARSGRLSIQYQCSRKAKGLVYPNADGNFTADGFEAIVTVSTAFSGDGDYNLTRKLTAKRVGDCPAAGTAKG